MKRTEKQRRDHPFPPILPLPYGDADESRQVAKGINSWTGISLSIFLPPSATYVIFRPVSCRLRWLGNHEAYHDVSNTRDD